MFQGPEHQMGWRIRIDVDGEPIEVAACHHLRHRLPRGHEIARQAAPGRQWEMVREVDFEWSVTHGRVRVCTLRQSPNGTFHTGAVRGFPGLTLAGAAEAAFRLERQRRAPAMAPDDRAPPGPPHR